MRLLKRIGEAFDGLIENENQAREAKKWLMLDLSEFGY